MRLEFDPKKGATNLRKHGVLLADAEPVFHDDQALTREDADANGEARFVTVGTDAPGRILTVCWTERAEAEGRGYQTLINEALSTALAENNAPVTIGALRKVLREELHAA